jgi:hypothetical protein
MAPSRLMRAGEVVVHEAQGDGVREVSTLRRVRERIRPQSLRKLPIELPAPASIPVEISGVQGTA